jgi:hypothetical protein
MSRPERERLLGAGGALGRTLHYRTTCVLRETVVGTANEADDDSLLLWLSTSSSEVSVTLSLTLCCPSSSPPVLPSPASQVTSSRTSAQGFSSNNCQTAPPSGSRTKRTTRSIGTPPSSNYVASSTGFSMRSRTWRVTWKQWGRCGMLGSRGGGTMSGGLWEGKSWKGGSCWYASFNCSTMPRENPDQVRLSFSATTEEIHFRTQGRRCSGTLCLPLSTLLPRCNPSPLLLLGRLIRTSALDCRPSSSRLC